MNALNGPWAIDLIYGRRLASIAYLIESGKMELSKEVLDLSAAEPYLYPFNSTNFPDTQGTVGVIPVEGPMVRDDQFCGPVGSMTLANHVREMDADPNVDAIVLRGYTPGGQVAGTEEFANAVASASKPVVGWGEMMASGGYYVFSGADFIVLSGKNASVGSIGVQMVYQSERAKLEKEGIETVHLRASTSPDKNRYDLDNLSEEAAREFEAEYLDPLDTNFMNHVRAHRVNISEDALTGKMYYAEQAIDLGMADAIGDFEYAVNLALEMAGKNQSTKMSKQDPASTANADPQASDLQAALDLAAARADLISAREATIETQALTISDLQSLVEAQKQRISALQTEVNRLQALPASESEEVPAAPVADLSTQQPTAIIPIPESSGIPQAMARFQSRKQRKSNK